MSEASWEVERPNHPRGVPRLHWLKVSDPDIELPIDMTDVDVRVLLPSDERFSIVREKLAAAGVEVRNVPYLLETEVISTLTPTGRLAVTVTECTSARPRPRQFPSVYGAAAAAAHDAFRIMWDTYSPVGPAQSRSFPVEDLVPATWREFLPHPTLNPGQAEAVPYVLGSDENLVVVAPTGAGKTVIGMVATLRTVLDQHRKAAWLVPQRSLTDELDRELDIWRKRGLRVERLSGEYGVDVERLRHADLWVATTEKFEALCRTSSLRGSLAEVGCLIVDEIHLLGDPTRGSTLEALLARVREDASRVRIVGLSATVSNADQIADWLRARLVRTAWRPSTLTWQLPTVAGNPDWGIVEAARTRLASAITATVAAESGSVLVFCGSKRGVRQTAMVIAAERGANIHGVRPDDHDRLYEVCNEARVGLHYKGWEHRHDAERGFRAKELDVLVATSTVAAGVNLPARAVVVRDTEVGLNRLDVATVQQMFGRAGRVGAGEDRGWAFLIVDETERAQWQVRLTAGYTVHSQIQSSLSDHVLAEAIQHRIRSSREAERWWVQTLAHHQGSRSLEPLREAIGFLVDGGFLTADRAEGGDTVLVPTELGTLTARIMVSTTVGHRLRSALARTPLPDNAGDAEYALIHLMATLVPKLAQASIAEDLKPAVGRILETRGHLDRGSDDTSGRQRGRLGRQPYSPGDLAKATLLAVANSPTAFHRAARQIESIPYASMYPVLEEAPRFFHWIASQGLLGAVHPWCAIVAADLERRIRWRRCQPVRGSGRLLWMCEQMATPAHIEADTIALWDAATGRGFTNPDWSATGKPQRCRLDDDEYAKLLRDRAADVRIEEHTDRVAASGPPGAVLSTWTGMRHSATAIRGGQGTGRYPDDSDSRRGAAVFTRRGDYRATGWLAQYSAAAAAGQ